MMRIAFDARKYGDYGIGTYIRALLGGFAVHASRPSLTLLGSRDGAGPSHIPHNWSIESVPYRLYGMGEFFRMGADIRASSCELFHAPHYTVPLAPGIPTVVTVHDLIQLRFPDIFSVAQRAYARFMIAHALRTASLVLTPSESTKADLVALFHADEARIKSIPLGVDQGFQPSSRLQIDLTRQKLHLPERYILFVGNPKPHKGISQLLKAMKIISGQHKDLSLVIAGGAQADETRIHGLASGLGIDHIVQVVSGVTAAELPSLYSGAELLAMPSLWEGFGLPVVEAMACGVPIVCSNAGSLPEVAGDAAVLVKPGDAVDLAAGMTSLLLDTTLQKDLRERGLRRASQYSWAKTVEATLAAYESVIR